MASTIGAEASARSYLSATAIWVGLVTTTSALDTFWSIRLRLVARWSERIRLFTSGSPSDSLCSWMTSCLVI